MKSRTCENYELVFSKVREIVNKDIGSHAGLHPGFYPQFIHADAEQACRQAALKLWPMCEYRYCYFHILQSFRRRLLLVPDMKTLIESGPGFNPKFSNFWRFLCGLPMLKLKDDYIHGKVIEILRDAPAIWDLKFNSKNQEKKFIDFLSYLESNYISKDARYNFNEWEMHTVFAGHIDTSSRTNNVSESINSQLNKEFRYKMNFNSSVANLYNYARAELRKKLGFETTEIAGLGSVIPSKKRSGRHYVDTFVFEKTRELVRNFSLEHDCETVNILLIKQHSIEMGSIRSDYYKNQRILFQDQYYAANESLDSTVDLDTVDSL